MASSADTRPLCPSCGRGYVVRRGAQRCFTRPGEPRCQPATTTTPERSAAQRNSSANALVLLIAAVSLIGGWLQGNLPLDASPADSSLTVWQLGQYAEAFYRS